MKKFFLINLSPRLKGTSVVLADVCKEYLTKRGHSAEFYHLYPNLNNPDKLYEAVNDADAVILSGPCYINTFPADTIAFLERLATHKELLHGQDLYGIIQGGMPYVHTHESGLLVLQAFGKKCNVNFKGGFVMGGGAMLDGKPIEKLLNARKVLKQLNIFFDCIEKGKTVPMQVCKAAQIKFPGIVCRVMAKLLNRAIDNDLKKHGIDANQPSPYLQQNYLKKENEYP